MNAPTCSMPQIDLAIECDGWPSQAVLLPWMKDAITAASKTALLVWPSPAELSVVLTSDAAMRDLNRKWRNKSRPTNVLSFPGDDILPGEPAGAMLGDLVFSLETVQREADEQGKSFEAHFTHLTVHGFLHLFGYDHIQVDQAEKMEKLEITALERLGIANPYA